MLSKEEHIARLIFLHMQGLTNEMQERELHEWRTAAPGREELFQRMMSREYMEKRISRFVKTEEEEEKRWQELRSKRSSGHSVRRIKWLLYAVAIALCLSVGGIFYFFGQEKQPEVLSVVEHDIQVPGYRAVLVLPDGRKVDLEDDTSRSHLLGKDSSLLVKANSLEYRDINTPDTTEVFHALEIPRGGEYLLVLSDSTVIYLNSESTLSFPVKFQGGERKVYLTGEAYFDVKKDTERPFVVVAGGLEVLVTGTTFGVRAYEDETDIQTTLESGKVTVRTEGKSVNLVPNKQALFDKSTMKLVVRDVDVDLYLAWIDGRMVYDNCPLEKILTDLGRWYDINVFYTRDELRLYQFSLNMKKHETFTDVLELIGKTGDVQFEIKDNTVIVK